MARAGADVVGVNCRFDRSVSLAAVGLMKAALAEAGLKVHLMIQRLGIHVPDASTRGTGYVELPEFPFGGYSIV